MFNKSSKSTFIVAILGPDGVGKTTSINASLNYLNEANYSFIKKHHVWGDNQEKTSNALNKQFFLLRYRKKSSNILRQITNRSISLLNLIYEEIKYVQRLNRMILNAEKKHSIIILDRFIYDKISAKSARNTLDLQYYLRVILARFCYRPDLCIVLSNTPEEIHKRKKELSIKEASCYLKSLIQILQKEKLTFQVVNTDKEPRIIGKEIFDCLARYNSNNRFRKQLFANTLDLHSFFKSIIEFEYVVLKHESPYQPDNFPKSYAFGKDLDLLVSKKHFKNVLKKAKKFLANYKDRYTIKRIDDSSCHTRFRLLQGQRLHFQIDISCSLEYCDSKFLYEIQNTSEMKNNFKVPRKEFEIWVRIIFFKLDQRKAHHIQYATKNVSVLNFLIVRNSDIISFAKKIFLS